MLKIKEMHRGIKVVAMFVLFGLGALFIRYLILPFKKNRLEKYDTLQSSWKFFIGLIEKLDIIKLEISDLDKIQNIKNSIIVSTHPSFIDIVILMSIIPRCTCFVAQKLAKNVFFRGMVKLLFILETDSIDEWLNDSCNKLNEGLNLIIFPMGGRHKKYEKPKIRRGASLIALKSLKNISVLKIETDTDFLQGNQPIYKAGVKPVIYSIKYTSDINTAEYIKKYSDEVSFKTELTKTISNALYDD